MFINLMCSKWQEQSAGLSNQEVPIYQWRGEDTIKMTVGRLHNRDQD